MDPILTGLSPEVRRTVIELQKQINELRSRVDGSDTTLNNHETRITALETP